MIKKIKMSTWHFGNSLLTMIVGTLITGMWPIYWAWVMKIIGRNFDFHVWYTLVLFCFLGGLLWAALQIIRGKNWTKIFILFILAVSLIMLIDFSYAQQGRTFYIGNLFEQASGIFGLASYTVSITLVIALADIGTSHRFGPLLFMTGGYLIYTINNLRDIQTVSGTDLNNLIIWVSVVVMSGGLVALISDLTLLGRWETSSNTERSMA